MSSRLRLIILLPLVLLVLTGYLVVSHLHKAVPNLKSYTPESATHTYVYSKLDLYTLPGTKIFETASFSKPTEFKVFGTTADGSSDQTLLIHQLGDHIVPDVGRIGLVEVVSSPANLATFQKVIVDPKNPAYASYLNTLTSFINQRLPLSYSSSVGAPKPFNSVNIAKNAWVDEFSAASTHHDLPALKGQALTVFTADRLYYFMVENVAADWRVNQHTWQSVINSLKIDQR